MSDGEGAGEAARILIWLVVALVLAFTTLGIVMAFGMGWMGHGMMGIGFGGMGILLAVPAIVIVVVLLLVLGAFDKTYPRRDTALETLDLRLAKGEIDLEEYRELKEQLRR